MTSLVLSSRHFRILTRISHNDSLLSNYNLHTPSNNLKTLVHDLDLGQLFVLRRPFLHIPHSDCKTLWSSNCRKSLQCSIYGICSDDYTWCCIVKSHHSYVQRSRCLSHHFLHLRSSHLHFYHSHTSVQRQSSDKVQTVFLACG